jgi:hypothetical protein
MELSHEKINAPSGQVVLQTPVIALHSSGNNNNGISRAEKAILGRQNDGCWEVGGESHIRLHFSIYLNFDLSQ